MTWLLRLFCRHRHVVLVKTYSEPRVPGFDAVKVSGELGWKWLNMQDRYAHGCTDVIVRCDKCGDCKNYTLLGKETEG